MKKLALFRSILLSMLLLMFLSLPACSKSDDSGGNQTTAMDDPADDPDPDPDPDPGPDPTPDDEPDDAPDAEESDEPAGPSIFKMNCGGDEITIDSMTFAADQFFVGNSKIYVNTFLTEINDTDLDEIFFTERISVQNRGGYGYQIPVTNGTYTVKLYFAEIFWGVDNPDGQAGGVGSRDFDVDIEGENKLNNLDIFALVGAETALVRMYDVEITDGFISIEMDARIDRPKLSAIEIFGDGEVLD